MKSSILKSLAFWLLVFACVTVAIGLYGFSISSYDKANGPSALFVPSLCVIGLGLLVAFISLLTGIVEIIGPRPK